MALKTETNTEKIEYRIQKAAIRSTSVRGHRRLNTDFEHGQWWVTCLNCGRQWSVVDAEGGPSVDGFDFEVVSNGDGGCE